MNNIFKYIICCFLTLSAVSCHQVDILEVGNDDIVLSFDGAAMTKADDTSDEAAVSHIDVLIFDSSETKVYNERLVYNGVNSYTLSAKRAQFEANADYYVYLVANASAAAADFTAVSNIQDLKSMVQQDPGLMFANVAEASHLFLMDAIAYTGSAESAIPGAVKLNDGVLSNDTNLKATLRRAAAKVLVTIRQGNNVTFADVDNSASARYYMRNCPSSTVVISGSPMSNPMLVTPDEPKAQNQNFIWGDKLITIAAYGYEYNWKDQSVHDKETSIIVNIPMMKDGELQQNNWYKVPVSQNSSFERNHIYTIDVTIDALGATNQDNPQEMDNVRYGVVDWEQLGVTVAQGSGAEYLQLNTNHVDMYNVNVDNTSLTFASSSPIVSITLNEAYFFNYLDQKVTVQSKFPTAYSGIKATYDVAALNGIITINSPFVAATDKDSSHSNAIRYMTFTVKNTSGQTATFTVNQYPTIYIKNEMGSYSYREDFGGTNYKNKGNPNRSGVNWDNNAWKYSNEASNSYFFGSKVATESRGSYTIKYAYWGNGNSVKTSDAISGLNNPRMYHVYVTSTSNSYVVARPRLDSNGYTERSEDNSKLVSPSFMIASQLGATQTPDGDINQAESHCEKYIEVTTDGKEYSDWRLPTAAEIDIIIQHQDISDAMAVVLTGKAYYCSWNKDDKGNVIYTKATGKNSSNNAVRCIRDAY